MNEVGQDKGRTAGGRLKGIGRACKSLVHLRRPSVAGREKCCTRKRSIENRNGSMLRKMLR
jgi:hypothetical protein